MTLAAAPVSLVRVTVAIARRIERMALASDLHSFLLSHLRDIPHASTKPVASSSSRSLYLNELLRRTVACVREGASLKDQVACPKSCLSNITTSRAVMAYFARRSHLLAPGSRWALGVGRGQNCDRNWVSKAVEVRLADR